MLSRRPHWIWPSVAAALFTMTPQLAAETAATSPASAAQPTPRDDDSWRAEHQRLNALPARAAAKLMWVGDSHLARWPTHASEVWNEFYAQRDSVNLGLADDGTQHVLWRLKNGHLDGCRPQLIVVHVGTGNLANDGDTPTGIVAGLTAIIQAVRERLPESEVLLLGVLPASNSLDEAQRLQLAELNRLASDIADWEHVHFLDVGCALMDSNGKIPTSVMSGDGTLTPDGYRRCATAMEFKIAELVGEGADQQIELFDGKSLAGWKAGDEKGAPQGWDVVDKTLTIVGEGTDAQTVDVYGNFDFQCEWKVEERSNSGIFYRWASYAGIVSAGPEYQVTDDLGRKLPSDLNSSTAATTDMYGPPANKPVRPAGEWNHTRIVAVEGNVENWLNGIRLYTFDMASKDWQRRLAKSKFRRLWPFGRIYEGAFRLQNYGGSPAAFRDITVTRL